MEMRTPKGGTPNMAVPLEKWPEWAKAMALLKQDGEIGVGDTVERIIGPAVGGKFKRWYKEKFGKSCGCERRKAEWNQKYRY